MTQKKQKIVPSLWFDGNAEEAVNFYTSVFRDSGIDSISRYTKAGQEIHQKEPGSVMTVEFNLAGFHLLAMNGGPEFRFNPSVSLFITGNDKSELKRLWQELIKDGEFLMPMDSYEWSEQYGWLKDKYGLNWQFMWEENRSEMEIIPLLFFTGGSHGKTEEAIRFYISVFRDSGIDSLLKYTEEDHNEYALGTVKHAQFQLEGQTFMAMSSGMENDYPFNAAVSFMVMCKDQQEINYYWDVLTKDPGAQSMECGWLKDKFGVVWQVIPEGMDKYFKDHSSEAANRVMEALMKMKKIDLEAFEKAVKGDVNIEN